MRKYSIHVGCLYLELVGSYQEEIDPAINRLRALYAHESTRPRAFAMDRAAPAHRATIYSQRPEEVRHMQPYGKRLRRISRDQHTTPEDRHGTLTHLLELIAVLGLNGVMEQFELPEQYGLKCTLAPEPLEVGSPYPHEDGADVVVSYGENSGDDPYPVTCGIDIKSASRSYRYHRPQYSDRLGAPIFDIYAGAWMLTKDGGTSLHDGILRAIESNERSKQFIWFMEKNIRPFGMYLAHQVASVVCKYEEVGSRFGHLRNCSPELASMYPRDEVAFRYQMSDIGNLASAFRANGVHSIWQPRYLQPPDLHYRFLPTTPLQ